MPLTREDVEMHAENARADCTEIVQALLLADDAMRALDEWIDATPLRHHREMWMSGFGAVVDRIRAARLR